MGTPYTREKRVNRGIITRRRAHFVHDGGLRGFAPIRDGNGLEALRTRETIAKLDDVEGDDLVTK
jgi:hypothetical protein